MKIRDLFSNLCQTETLIYSFLFSFIVYLSNLFSFDVCVSVFILFYSVFYIFFIFCLFAYSIFYMVKGYLHGHYASKKRKDTQQYVVVNVLPQIRNFTFGPPERCLMCLVCSRDDPALPVPNFLLLLRPKCCHRPYMCRPCMDRQHQTALPGLPARCPNCRNAFDVPVNDVPVVVEPIIVNPVFVDPVVVVVDPNPVAEPMPVVYPAAVLAPVNANVEGVPHINADDDPDPDGDNDDSDDESDNDSDSDDERVPVLRMPDNYADHEIVDNNANRKMRVLMKPYRFPKLMVLGFRNSSLYSALGTFYNQHFGVVLDTDEFYTFNMPSTLMDEMRFFLGGERAYTS